MNFRATAIGWSGGAARVDRGVHGTRSPAVSSLLIRPRSAGAGPSMTHAVLKTIAAFLNTEGGDLLIGVGDDRTVLGIENDHLESDDKFMRHLAQVVRNGLGNRAGTCIDPKTQIVEGKTVCLVSCQRSPEPVFLRWKGLEKFVRGDFYVRSGPGTVRLGEDDAEAYIVSRFRLAMNEASSDTGPSAR